MKKMLTRLFVFFLFGVPAIVNAQSTVFSNELRFARYLLDKEMYAEGMKVLMALDTTAISPEQKDSFYYTVGWAAYQYKQLDTAATMLLKVSPRAEVYRKSNAFAAYSMAFNQRLAEADAVFAAIPYADSLEYELVRFERAGIALLQRDYHLYDSLKAGFRFNSYVLQQEEKRMNVYRTEMGKFRNKSPLLAGVYSALLPGAGKWYAGKKKQGIAAFLPVASLGAITYEAYRKGGVKSARFIAFGSLFSLFYVGNIWGSVLSVKVRQNEFKREYENKILFDMHIPLRNFYN